MLLQMKEWLCLNCQIQRTSGPPNPTQPKPINAPAPALPQKDVQAQVSQSLSPQQSSKGGTSAKPVLSQTETSKVKSGFTVTHDQSQSPFPQLADSTISEKDLGFGSSIISTASDLISSAVQDEASITPPSSHKSSAVSEASIKTSTPPASRKVPVASEKDLSSNEPESITQEPRSEEKISELQTTKEQSAKVKEDGKEACPLCNEKCKNDPPNFNTCTSCKMTVCNLCGFNPMPDQTEVGPCQSSEYYCVNVPLLHRLYGGSNLSIIKTKNEFVHSFGNILMTNQNETLEMKCQILFFY